MFLSKDNLIANLDCLKIDRDDVRIVDRERFIQSIDEIVETIVLQDSQEVKNVCYWLLWEGARQSGIIPSSIDSFYAARGKGEFSGFTVPAMNLRTFTYEQAKAAFRIALKKNIGAFIFEIAKSEIGYTGQRPAEYTSMILAAALKEGYKGPVFIQGDHFQAKAKDFIADPGKETGKLKELMKEALSAGFFNIDIDSSTLVDLSKESLDEQQKYNYEVCAELSKFIRGLQPEGINVSIGGEIGEVGGRNSTPEDLRAFMGGLLASLGSQHRPISKISIQTGTSHGGVVLPDGSIAQVNIDFNTLENLSEIARREYGMAGCVQHGASTLPSDAFHKFPEVETAEIHLATQFQNIVYDNLPIPVKEKIYKWIGENLSSEKKEKDTREQFIYKTRKKALGPFKKDLFKLPKDIKNKIARELEKEIEFLFSQLRIENTYPLIEKYVQPVEIKKRLSDFSQLK